MSQVTVPEPEQLLTIGVFARRSRLSAKALRLYDRLGLLTPAHVDPHSGYRRYRESQLRTARLVALLRRLDMPLAQVAEIVAEPGERAAGIVETYWAAVERRVAFQRELAAHLRIRLSGGEPNRGGYGIAERDVAEQTVLTELRHVRADDLASWIGAAMTRLHEAAAAVGGVAGAPLVIYHGEVSEDSDGPVEACVPVDPARAAAAPPAAVAVRREPAHREAYTRLVKAQVEYPQILSAYDAVAHWLNEHGRTAAGAPREVYFTDFIAAAPGDEVCDVAYPMR